MTENAYAKAGVDTEAGDLAVELMKRSVSATHNDLVFGGLGGFAGMMDVSFIKNYQQPLLATSTDGVGTKVAIAQAIDKHDTIGQDLVGMVVDDIVVVGAKSLFMTDYIACGKVIPERIADIVRGIAEACSSVGVALVGGETAEHPGLLGVDDYDVAGAAVGVVDAAKLLGPQNVRVGDVVLGMHGCARRFSDHRRGPCPRRRGRGLRRAREVGRADRRERGGPELYAWRRRLYRRGVAL